MNTRTYSLYLLVIPFFLLFVLFSFLPNNTFIAKAHASIAALPLISQNVPAYSNDPCYAPSRANDTTYDTQWQGCNAPSASNPTWLAYDMSHALNGGAPGRVILSWDNDPKSGSITNFDNPPSNYFNINAYTIDVNPAPGGTAAPTSGWVTLVTVSGNYWSSKQHLIDMTGYNWVRIAITAQDSKQTGVALNMDVHDASQVPANSTPEDDWIFFGDSITAAGLNHDPRGIGTFEQLINTQTNGAYYPVEQDLGLGGTNVAYGAAHINDWLPYFPGKYVGILYGTNDANGCGTSNDSFYTKYIEMIQAILAAGKVPVIPYIPWAPSPTVQQCAGDPNADPSVSPHLNAMITKLYNDPVYGSQIVRGPDLWTTFYNQPALFRDSLHPNETDGYDLYRNVWVTAMLNNVYQTGSPTPTPTLIPTATPTPTIDPSITPTPTDTPTPTMTPTPFPTATPTPLPTATPTPTPTGTQGTVSFIGSVTGQGNFGAGIKLKLPTVQAGDFLIAVAGTNGSPSNWTTPTGWTAGANSGHPGGQGLNWWYKKAVSADSGTTITLKSSSYADGGGEILIYRGISTNPVVAVSSMNSNSNNGNGHVNSAVFNSLSWTPSSKVVNLLLMSWQPNAATLTWPANYILQKTATDGYGYVAVGANLNPQTVSSLSSQTVTLSASQALVPTLQVAIGVQ